MKAVSIAVGLVAGCGLGVARLAAAEQPGDRMLAEYFRQEVARLHERTFAGIKMLADWQGEREADREQLREMLGLSPRPERSDLKPVVTGREDQPDFFVEKLHYQSLPGLYVTANLYIPAKLTGRAPAILYVCGHRNVKEEGVSYGAKANYHYHAAWLARHGYVCLIIDTIQLGELEGVHAGTMRDGMWWWNARGYTPAGVEVWNCMRSLDYLQSRPEVDGDKIGMTGRSGGGAYTWYTAALDERIKVAAPISGITDLQNHVVDGCVSRHCDCMYPVNTYRWDFGKVAALVAPRPLLMGNGDKETLFPLDGVLRIHAEVASIYRLHGADDHLGLLITEGPHKDTQDLQVPVLRWFNRWLKGEDPLISLPAAKVFRPQQLKVFPALPSDERTTRIHETFVPAAAPRVPADESEWRRQCRGWLQALREKSFAGWPNAGETSPPALMAEQTQGGVAASRWEFTSQESVRLPLIILARGKPGAGRPVRLQVVDDQGWNNLVGALAAGQWDGLGLARKDADRPADPAALAAFAARFAPVARGELALAYLPPRGIGPTAWSGSDLDQIQIRRRFMLVGQTLEGMRVWDIRRAVAVLRRPELFGDTPVQLAGERHQAVNAIYAALFSGGVASVEMMAPPTSHATGPDYLNVLRFLDVPQAVAMVAEHHPVTIVQGRREDWAWVGDAAQHLGWPSDHWPR